MKGPLSSGFPFAPNPQATILEAEVDLLFVNTSRIRRLE
ncbi:hypothetical protein PIIN_11212 [Serendipita indica DSM 11827]|uniref:Uncharacterized protein n=1 Tax=Serendipita indica (strain DSM 11827) TaxID=1109443 RepID=G4U0Y6_SERID|nr:hypothetical protein PIIN_11212 [Serendipita indica DSM 11827]